MHRIALVLGLFGLAMLSTSASGCGSGTHMDTGGTVGTGPSLVEDEQMLPVNKSVDILFVIDNSGSMGEEQALLVDSFPSLMDTLEADADINYRVGVTTTDNGNPWCPSAMTTPEAGNLVMSSCKDRLGDFVFNDGEVDVRDLACNDLCALDSAALEILPTTTELDPNPTPRPWLERITGVKNIPESTSSVEAFGCFGPQGVNGCGFESPLESMYLALIRASSAGEANRGFLRPDAVLALVFLTNEVDCSYDKDWSEIFELDGNRVFWSDPTASAPSSAVCWNAGVECLGDPSNYDSCEPNNHDVLGNAGVPDDAAVLHPMSRYLELLEGLEAQQQQFNPSREIIVALIAGVGTDGAPFYADVSQTDPEFQDSFGIGPGCVAPNPDDPSTPIQAVPPVRLRALADAFSPGNSFSICEPDYGVALEAIAVEIRDQLPPACYTKCVDDGDPTTELVEPECVVEENPPGNDNATQVPECLREGGAYVMTGGDYTMPTEEANACYAMLTDKDMLTPSLDDDMSEFCAEQRFNLELALARRPGLAVLAGTSVSASCELASFPEDSCPGIGG